MRYIIATTRYTSGMYRFTKGNLKQLSIFKFLPIEQLDEKSIIGSATLPKLSECGNTLTAELSISDPKYLDARFSVGYRISNSAFSVERDEYIITDLDILSVFPTKHMVHD